MGIYSDNKDKEIGRQAQINAQATRKGSQMAEQQRMQEDMQQQAIMEQQMQQQQGQQQAYQAGAQDQQQQNINEQVNNMLAQQMADRGGSGLGMGSQTVEAIQNQDNQRQQAMQEAAMQFMQEVSSAQQQGAPAEYIQEMYAKVPPELRGTIENIQKQQMQRNAPQDRGMY